MRFPADTANAAVAFLISTLAAASAQSEPSHPVRQVRDLTAAAEHLEKIGFQRERTDDAAILLRRDTVLVEVSTNPASDRVDDGRWLPTTHVDRPLLVQVGSVDAERRRLEKAGIKFEVLIAQPSAATSLRVADPDGWITIFRAKPDIGARVVPASGELNAIVLEVLRHYPTAGEHQYWWPRGEAAAGWTGATHDLRYDGEILARGDPQGRCYCCGLTFEVFVEAWHVWCDRNARPWRIAGLNLGAARRLQRQWFGSAADRTCVRTALVDNNLGHSVTDLEQAQAGDFVQLWRANGSGHSVVFLDWVREKGVIVGLRYWSTQTTTKGIGERVERFDKPDAKHLLRDDFHLCRVGIPAPHD